MHLHAVRPVLDRPGPYLTVHAEVGRTDEHALDQLDARWTSLRHELEHHDVDRALVEQLRPQVILVAGDVRAADELVEALGRHPTPVVRLHAGGRASGISEEALWQEIDTVLAEHEAHADHELAERLDEGQGRAKGVAVGSVDVLEALVRGQVDELVLDPVQVRDATVHPADFPGLKLPEPARSSAELPADRVLVAAAARSDSAVSLLPEALVPGHGVAAILRWDG